jgi:hypothetical protein
MNFFLLPAINVGLSIFIFAAPQFKLYEDPISGYVVFYSIVCFHRILEFFTIIRRSIVLEAKIFLE